MKSRGEKFVGPPDSPRCMAPRALPPFAIGAKLARLQNNPAAPLETARLLKP
jgi:hypothetical protein